MTLDRHVVEELMVQPGDAASIGTRPTNATSSWPHASGRNAARAAAEKDLETWRAELDSAQELLYASGTWSLLIIFQGPDAAGKDGTISHVLSGVNPQGFSVTSFKEPSSEELRHDFLWRCVKALPERGGIGIFNRSYYEEVLVPRVHPEILAAEHLPTPPAATAGEAAAATERFWRHRYGDINAFERHLTRSGTRIVKFFLHVSKATQRKRLLERLDDPAKHWKFSASDVSERAHFEAYQHAYEEALTATSTAWAPWYVIPADHKYLMRALVAGVLVDALGELDLHLPELTAESRAALDAARATLLAEDG